MLEVKTLSRNCFLDIELLENGSLPESTEPHRHQYFEIFWALEGEGSHSIDFLRYPLITDSIYFITPGQVHHCHDLPEKLYAISFDASLLSTDRRSQHLLQQIFFQNRSQHPSILIDPNGKKALVNILNILESELKNTRCDNEFLSMLFTSFLCYVSRYQPDKSSYQLDDKRMQKLLDIIDKNYIEHKNTLFYAEKLSLSKKRVIELSQQYFSKTVTQLIHEKTITEARRLLAFSNTTIKAIALELGYKDTAYFCRFFKKTTSESPLEFRRRWTDN
ncbi:putative Transcriptional regulator, AraC family [Vibrio nigripulchritudo SFn27]|uniref:Putative Transcriptional regulator, AraC family n=1 Tax=Vibrio nigripulchritudo TaxID=28173 RepID=U4KCM6_9VIBR|nr:helix-turn-helix domain-containing protein [Vibrio nigripulchritudo]CCN80458.1 putative Transcriptional regulator, AraC family [Vibrio nigripulchritudo BLFn1]CCN86931.1 putative Transcriptional regulator, AraC family [Vibrio nigripulchritudo SFn27]CCN92394.1 putative Transcriptional regulator, AraC family [Vibrio nigripulchritudo ENn2]CCO39734.1 putative Transcriptional regulator, AraC family [Vibrio nigripulchritudo SFn135]CCO53337.1 putative Transcriptional regulator, AraC family [Vibrio 